MKIFNSEQNLTKNEAILFLNSFYFIQPSASFFPQVQFSPTFQNFNESNYKVSSITENKIDREIKALIVDDDRDFGKALLNHLLDLTNITIAPESVSSVEKAIKKIETSSYRYDVIFIDIVLQDVNGIVIYEKSKELGYLEENILMMTSELESPQAELVKQRNLKVYDKVQLKHELPAILFSLFGDFNNEQEDFDN